MKRVEGSIIEYKAVTTRAKSCSAGSSPAKEKNIRTGAVDSTSHVDDHRTILNVITVRKSTLTGTPWRFRRRSCQPPKRKISRNRSSGHVKVMNSSTPLRPRIDAPSDPQNSSSRRHDGAVPSTSQQRSAASTIALGESTFDSIALDVSYAGLDVSGADLVDSGSQSRLSSSLPSDVSNAPHLWEDIGVVEYLDRKLGPPDESTPEERVDTLREILAETDIHEGDGKLSDFLFHVARTKYGKVYIRVIRTLLLNRGKSAGPRRQRRSLTHTSRSLRKLLRSWVPRKVSSFQNRTRIGLWTFFTSLS